MVTPLSFLITVFSLEVVTGTIAGVLLPFGIVDIYKGVTIGIV